MTEEQMKRLKVGDRFVVTLAVTAEAAQDVTGLWCIDAQPVGHNGTHQSHTYDTECLSVVPLLGATFEVGDTVRIINDPLSGRVHGAHYAQILEGRVGKVAHVRKSGERDAEGETDDEGTVWIRCEGNNFNWGISPHCVELVEKAVKDKYRVVHAADGAWMIIDATLKCSIVEYWSGHPSAKEAADAECARLNSEWRKQHESAAVCDSGVTKGGSR